MEGHCEAITDYTDKSIFVVFTIATLLMCIYATLHYLSLSFDIIDFNSYYTKEVADTVVGILEREQHSYLRLGVYFIFQWMAGLIIFITTKRKTKFPFNEQLI